MLTLTVLTEQQETGHYRAGNQSLPDKVRLHILYHAEMAPVHSAWMAGELAHHGYKISPEMLHPVLYRMHDEGLLQPDQQVVDGRARRVYDITPSGLAVLERHQSDLHRDETTARE